MAIVTQRVQNYLGGVSKQPDDKKFPGQVRDALNSYPDPTFGLQKRPGLKFLTDLKDGIYGTGGTAFSGTTLDNAKWFYIHRDGDEKYIGCILGNSSAANAAIHIWNASPVDGVALTTNSLSGGSGYSAGSAVATTGGDGTGLTVTTTVSGGAVSGVTIVNGGTGYAVGNTITIAGGSGGTFNIASISNSVYKKCDVTASTTNKAYLSATTKNDYHVLTIQDTTIITNKKKTTTTQADPTFNANRQATIRLLGVDNSSIYKVIITTGGSDHTATYTSDSTANSNEVLAGIKSAIDGLSISNLTVTQLTTSLELSSSSAAFTLKITDAGIDGNQLSSFQDELNNIAQLPNESKHDRVIKIINTASEADDFYTKFVAKDGVSGAGYWEETLGHGMSPGLTASTMPHELVNTSINVFTFQPITWTARLVGDNITNAHPSFKDKTIKQAFFSNNRLGFLSEDNVILSQSGDFYNFYSTTAQTISAADPIDLNCSSLRPAVLHSILPAASGLILFAENQQFIMYAADGNLTPTTAVIRNLSNFEMDTNINPVDVGTTLNFISKTPAYSRVFSMVPRGEGQIPLVNDIGKIVSEYLPETIDSLIASPQNSFIALYGGTTDLAYFYRTHNEGNQEVLKAWFNWKFPGNILELVIDSDVLYAIIKVQNGYRLISANLSSTPEDEIIITSDGTQINPYMDLYAKASSVTYDSTTGDSKCYLPYTDVTTLTPIIVISGNAATNYSTIVQSGFTMKPTTRASDGTGPYFLIENIDLSGQASNVIVGYTFDYDITLPKTYFQLGNGISDYTAPLTIARMKFSVGRSSTIGFKLTAGGLRGQSWDFSNLTDGSRTEFSLPFDIKDKDDIKVSLDGTNTTNFTITDSGVITMGSAPAATVKMIAYEDNWYDIQPVQEANQYLADDVPMTDQNVYTIPIHQRTSNFLLRVFSDSPFPVSLTSMMWEGNYSPRYYRRN